MSRHSSRRFFLAAGLGAPAAIASTTSSPQQIIPGTALSFAPKGGIKLQYRTLGKTKLKVTTVAFGSMITSDPTVIERAIDMGVNYVDTARVYRSGNCERMVGVAIKGKRDKIILSTKSKGKTKEAALADLDTSLRELGTDHVDIWYLHAINSPSEVNDSMMEAQEVARKAGKIRFNGLSTHKGHKEVVPFVAERNKHFDVLLVSYNFTMEPEFTDYISIAAKAGLGVVGMKVMAGGQTPLPVTPSTQQTKDILKKDGAMLAALKWTLKNKNIHTTIPSMVDVDQLEENVLAMAQPFSKGDEKILQARLEQIRPNYCSMCNSCAGTCVKGLPVADIHRYLMYAENYGEFGLGYGEFKQLPAEIASIRCSDCSKCTVQCPNGVRVVERMTRSQDYFA